MDYTGRRSTGAKSAHGIFAVRKQQNRRQTRKKANGQNRTVRECALALLEFRDRTERELRRKLKEREYSTEEIDETVLFLKEYRYLDDAA